eukprot:1139233-Amphidinium_carterae.1
MQPLQTSRKQLLAVCYNECLTVEMCGCQVLVVCACLTPTASLNYMVSKRKTLSLALPRLD